jgi:membrane associated rhomboid family serine protease
MLGLSDRAPERVRVPSPPAPTPHQLLRASLRARTGSVRATYAILLANVLIFAALALASGPPARVSPGLLIASGGLFGPRTTDGEWWRFLTAIFLHAHPPHLVLNMLGLILVGPALERVVGRAAFVVFYVACGLVGSAAGLLAHPFVVGVGASGAILGLYGMLLGLMVGHRGPTAPRAGVDTEAAHVSRSQLQVYLGPCTSCIVGGIVMGWWVPNVGTAAHAGGAAAGLLFGWTIGRRIEWAFPRTRHLIGALSLAVACCAAALAASDRLVEPPTWMVRVLETDSRIAVEYNGALETGTDDALRALIETRILPALAAEREALPDVGRVAPQHADILRDLREYVALREAAWRHRAVDREDLRPHAEGRASELERRAEVVMRRLLRAVGSDLDFRRSSRNQPPGRQRGPGGRERFENRDLTPAGPPAGRGTESATERSDAG